jgi:hypothetical protein
LFKTVPLANAKPVVFQVHLARIILMTHPLEGARLKLIRAKEHLRAFDEDGTRYLRTEPYEIVAAREGSILKVECVITAEPPHSLSCIIGDLVTNLRASLDYVAWALVDKHGNMATLSDGQKRKIAFPITSSRVDFADKNSQATFLKDKCGVPTKAMTVIESVQPYNGGYERMEELKLLVNTDKHQTLLLCASYVLEKGDISYFQGDRLCWHTMGGIQSTFDLSQLGRGLTEGPPITVKPESKPTILIGLKDLPQPSTFVGILPEILKCVEGAVAQFEPFF